MPIHPFPAPPATPPEAKPVPALSQGHLHEIHAGLQDWAAALGFVLGGFGAKAGLPLVLVRSPRGIAKHLRLHGEGLLALGIDPARLLIVETSDEQDMLRAGLDAARSSKLAGVVLESWGKLSTYDLTASRRLVLAGERSGVGVAVLRGDAPPRPSAARTRWGLRALPSNPLPAKASGMPAIEAELQRQRGGSAGLRWRLEWDKAHGIFREASIIPQSAPQFNNAPPSGAVVPFPALRAG
jgi:protein ImuA